MSRARSHIIVDDDQMMRALPSARRIRVAKIESGGMTKPTAAPLRLGAAAMQHRAP